MARAKPAKRCSSTPSLLVLPIIFLLIGLQDIHGGAGAEELSLGSEFYRQFVDLDADQSMVVARAVNSSVNGACLRDNLAPSVDLTIGGASSGPRTLNQYDCLVYGFTVQPDDLGGDDIVFTITSPSSPTPRYTTWRFYREEITLARNDNTFDLTSEGLSFVMPNCMAKLTRRWIFTLTSTETYTVNLATAYAAPGDEIELDGISDFVGTWTTTNSWQVFKFNSDSVLATQSATLNFASSTSEMTIYTRIGACPTMHYTYRYSVVKPDSTEGQKRLAVSNTDSVVYMAVAPLAEGYSGTGDITLGYTLAPSVCRELPTSVPFCSQVYWPTVGNDSQAHVRTRDDSAKTFYDDTVLAYPKVNSDCLSVFKDYICLTMVAPPCRVESKKGIPLCQDWCDMVYSSCPTRFVSQVLQAELRDWCLRPGAEIRNTEAQSKIKPPINCFHTPIPDPIDIWDFTERPMRNPLMWTLAGFGAYMAAAMCLALAAVAVFLHMERKRRKQKRLTTALQQLGLALD